LAQKQALGRKVSDEFTVPLCRSHHRELHRSGDEYLWWENVGIDPLKIARKLWKKTRRGPLLLVSVRTELRIGSFHGTASAARPRTASNRKFWNEILLVSIESGVDTSSIKVIGGDLLPTCNTAEQLWP
jgi:hypothetical protein